MGQNLHARTAMNSMCDCIIEQLLEEKIQELQKCINDVKKGYVFYNNELPPNDLEITYMFKHRYDKRSYVAIEFIKNENTFNQIRDAVFSVSFKGSQINEIAFIHWCLYENAFGALSENIEYLDEEILCNDKNLAFLRQYHLYHRITELLRNFRGMLYYEPIAKEARDIKREYFDEVMKAKYNEIYQNLVASGEDIVKWKSEQMLYMLCKSIYPDALYQYKDKWLGNQSLDVYIPSIQTAIEYQGLQHYEPVEIFGGEEQFAKRQQLDQRKRRLCMENNVRLIEWSYEEPIMTGLLKQKLDDNKNPQHYIETR